MAINTHNYRSELAEHARAIWQAGVEAVKPRSLMQQKIHRDGHWLVFDDQLQVDLTKVGRLVIVGAGKASASMATEFLNQHCQDWPASFPRIAGWINAPAGTFHQQPGGVQLFAARPAAMNSPTQAAIEGTGRILQLVSESKKNDLVICMISGGGSALLVSPQPGISLADKQAVAKCVSAAGGNIVQLNTIRSCLSQVKCGGLVRACRAGQLISLIISDVLGDPLNIIASGPTVLDIQADHKLALAVIDNLGLARHTELTNVVHWLKQHPSPVFNPPSAEVTNIVLGNLADAVDAAGVQAVALGYRYHMQLARQPEGDVHDIATQAFQQMTQLAQQPEIDCWISGGEPTVRLPADNVGLGGRNQQLTLDLLNQMLVNRWGQNQPDCQFAFLSGGTDGEDGPTTAAGAWIDSESLSTAAQQNLNINDYLRRADAYHYFEKQGGLLVTGPTNTNVCDLRVGIALKQ